MWMNIFVYDAWCGCVVVFGGVVVFWWRGGVVVFGSVVAWLLVVFWRRGGVLVRTILRQEQYFGFLILRSTQSTKL